MCTCYSCVKTTKQQTDKVNQIQYVWVGCGATTGHKTYGEAASAGIGNGHLFKVL